MAYQSEIELRVKVVAKELNDLEQRINKIQTQAKSVNPFTASGASRGLKQQERALSINKQALDIEKQSLKAKVASNNERIKSLNLNTSWYKALETGHQIQLDINKAVANEAKLRAKTRRAAIGRKATDIATGAGFPLLFGGGIGQAVAGGLGGAVGGLGGSIAASAVVSQVQALFDSFGQLAAAMDQPVQLLEELANKGYDVGASTKSYVEALESQGRFAEAAEVANKELNKALGADGVAAAKAYQDAQDDLKEATRDLSLKIMTELGPAVTAFIGYVENIVGSLSQGIPTEAGTLSPEDFREVYKEAQERAKAPGILGALGMGNQEKFFQEITRLTREKLKASKEENTEQEGTADTLREQLEILRRRASLRANELPRIRQEEQFLKRELEIMRMTGPLQQMQKQTAEALLKADQARFDLLQARQELQKQQRSPEFDGIKELELLREIEEAAANSRRAEVEAEIAVEAERVYNFYTAQADALQDVVHQSKMRLDQEKAVLQGRNKLTGAYYSAELKINALAIQRKKQQVALYGLDGDRLDLLKLELLQVELIYKQTVAQINAEVEQVRLQARQVLLATKQAEVDFLRKKAKGQLKEEDYQALRLQRESLKIANYNVRVQEKVAEQQIKGAQATAIASKEALKFTYNQEKAAQAANNTARAMGRAANAASRAAKAAGGRNDTFFVNGKEYTYQGSRTSSIVGSGVSIVTRSHNFNNQAANSALHGAMARGSSSQYSGSSQPSSSPQGGGGGRRPTRTVNLPGGGSITTVGNMPGTNRAGMGGSVTYNAEGSYVTRPITSLIGERGENEYVIPESKMNSAMKRYARGTRGESVVEGSGETSAAGRKRSGAVVNISTGPVMQMDGQDYVTVSDLNDAVGNVAAAMSSSGSEGYGGKARLS